MFLIPRSKQGNKGVRTLFLIGKEVWDKNLSPSSALFPSSSSLRTNCSSFSFYALPGSHNKALTIHVILSFFFPSRPTYVYSRGEQG